MRIILFLCLCTTLQSCIKKPDLYFQKKSWSSLIYKAYENSTDFNCETPFIVSMMIDNIQETDSHQACISYYGYPKDFDVYIYYNHIGGKNVKLNTICNGVYNNQYSIYSNVAYLDSATINNLNKQNTILVETSTLIQLMSIQLYSVDSIKTVTHVHPINWKK